MIHPADFRVLRVQAAAFFPGDGVRPARMLRLVPEDWEAVYDGDPISLPLPPGASINVPGLILQSRDQTQTVQVSRTRIDLVVNCESTAVVDLSQTLGSLAGRLTSFSESTSTPFGRVAAVITRVAEEEQPGIALSRQFCRDEWLRGPLNRPEGFELHAHKVFDLLAGVPVNSWMRIKTAKLGQEPYHHVLVEQDINTLAEELEGRRFDRSQVARWFQEASRQLDVVLGLYFPPMPGRDGV